MVENVSVGQDAGVKHERLSEQHQEIAPVLVHIGLHKTGSTWVQRYVFKHPERGFTDATGEPHRKIIKRFVMPDPLFFDPVETASHYAPARDAAREAGATFVISHERLSGHPSSGGVDRGMIADRLRATFPDARVLIVIREQRSLIESMYGLHIRLGGVESVHRYLTRPKPYFARKPSFSLEMYEFDRLIDLYQKLFGKDRVLVLPLELLARQPQQFVDRITAFCGHPPIPLGPTKRLNVRRPHVMQLVQRPLNMLFYHNELSPGALVNVQNFKKRYARFSHLFKRLSPGFLERKLAERQKRAVHEFVGDHYAESNRRTVELTGLPLEEFGYPVK